MPQSIIFRNSQAPGDVMMMSAAVRDLHRCYPGRFVTTVETTAKDVWKNNPHVSSGAAGRGSVVKLGYPLIKRSNQSQLHFLQGFIDDLNVKLKLKVRLTEFRADLHWSEEEKARPPLDGPYWLILSGGKADFRTKWWDPARHQAVVDQLRGEVRFVQIGNKPDGGGARHYHPALSGVTNLVGQTTLREALHLLLHSRGVICAITCFMHAAAALGKPAVIVAGGREHWTWEAYTLETLRRNLAYAAGRPYPHDWESWHPEGDPAFVDHPFVPHVFLHTLGQLRCCKDKGCWKGQLNDTRTQKNCLDVVRVPGRPDLPRCLDMITADHVVAAVRHYEQNWSAVPPTVRQLLPKTPLKETSAVLVSARAPSSDQPALKLPLTVGLLTYGDYGALALRCLRSLYAYTNPADFRLRVAMNEPAAAAREELLRFLEGRTNVERVYEAAPQLYKYPMMRRMFYDEECPVQTDWLLWLDDDAHFTDPSWLSRLGADVEANLTRVTASAPRGHVAYGKIMYWHYRGRQEEWIKEASWYTGRSHALDPGKYPPRPKVDFCLGGFWLLPTAVLRELDWPDPRLRHRGGDLMLGAALWQRGYGLKQSCFGVKINDSSRRGYDEPEAGRV